MDCPKCGYILVEDPDVGLATCPECDTVVEMEGGPELPVPEGSMNMIPVGGVFRSALRVYRQEMHLFLGIWAIPALLGFVMGFFLLMGSKDLPADSEVFSSTELYTLQGLLFLSEFFSTLLNIFFSAVVIRMAADVFLHGKTSLSSGLGVFKKRIPVVLLASLLFALAVEGGGFLCYYIPSLLCCYWWMFSLVIIILEGASLSEAFTVSREFARSRSSFSFTLSLILIIAFMSFGGSMLMLGLDGLFSSMQLALLTNIVLSIARWFVFPFLIISIVAFYISGRNALKTEMAAAEEEGEEGDEEPSGEDESPDGEEPSKEDEGAADEKTSGDDEKGPEEITSEENGPDANGPEEKIENPDEEETTSEEKPIAV